MTGVLEKTTKVLNEKITNALRASVQVLTGFFVHTPVGILHPKICYCTYFSELDDIQTM